MSTVIIDVREPHEFAGGHVNGALNIPVGDIAKGTTVLNNIPVDSPIVVYCRSGGRASMAMQILQQMGYKNITNGINQKRVEATYGL